MDGSKIFPVVIVICVMSVGAQPRPPHYHHYLQTTSPNPLTSSWSFAANEIQGSGGSAFRPPPGVLIAGHGPPVQRYRPRTRTPPLITSASRLVPLISTSTATPSVWPSHGPQIQRAHEMSHFEYEVFPHPMNSRRPLTRPPRTFRPQPVAPVLHHQPRRAPPPAPTYQPAASSLSMLPAPVPEELLRILAQDGVVPLPPSPSPPPTPPFLRSQGRTNRPQPPPTLISQPMSFMPTEASSAIPPKRNNNIPTDFQEGFRILSDLFMEEAGADIRSNLVGGGADISFNHNYFPIASLINPLHVPKENISVTQLLPRSSPPPPPQPSSPNVEISQAKEEIIAIPEEPSSEEEEGPQILSTPKPPQPLKKPSQPTMQQAEATFNHPRYQPGPPSPASSASHVSFMYTDPNERPGYTVFDGGYQGPPPPFHTGGNSINQPPPPYQSAKHKAEHTPQKNDDGGYKTIPESSIMMVPLSSAEGGNNEPLPSSEEVQRALAILSRYATKQASNAGITPNQMALQIRGHATSNEYSLPTPHPIAEQQQQHSSRGGGIEYGLPQIQQQYGPPQQQSTPVPAYLPPSITDSALSDGISVQGPSDNFLTTTEPADSNGVQVAQQEESAPFPSYGPPGYQTTGVGEGVGWGSGTVSGGYEGGSSSGGGATDIIGAKVQALKTIQSAVTGSIKQITGLKKGIFDAGLNAIGSIGKAKEQFTNSLKIPIVSPGGNTGWGQQPSTNYGPPGQQQQQDGPVTALLNGVKEVVGGIATTAAQTGRAAVGIGLSKKDFVNNHFVIKGQAFTDTVSKKLANKNTYFQNVLKHVQSIFESAKSKQTGGGWAQN